MRERLRVIVTGAVQGVGFRPFVYRLAAEMGLDGHVCNAPQGVFIEVEGQRPHLERFLQRVVADRPPRAIVQGLEPSWLDPCGYTGFAINESATGGAPVALVLPDIGTCDDCLREVLDPANRRYRYPFTNCTNCGPRFTIIESLPYDRPATSMRRFAMCEACRREYEDPTDRRFHAQPNACPACGPQLALLDADGGVIEVKEAALALATTAIRDGRVVAVKGLGGFHLMALAGDERAVQRLRARKHREEKPFAVMFPSVSSIERVASVTSIERRVLTSPECPIVLLDRRPGTTDEVADAVAPRNPALGAMLPYTPLHHLLLGDLGCPVVATSGNLSDEPICTDEREALDRLRSIADLFLVHDRPIVRHVDDSIVRVVLDRELVLRRARGYAPLPIPLRRPAAPLLAVGAHLKNTVAVTAGANAFVSQHIGDLETPQSLAAFHEVIGSLRSLYRSTPERVAADLHPNYVSTAHARSLGIPVVSVQHHYAHVAACMADNDLDGPVLGVSWDGTGYGSDGTIWGGEFLLVGGVEDGDSAGREAIPEPAPYVRVATLRPFRLPGGERAVREPRRSALGVLFEIHGSDAEARDDFAPVAAFDQPARSLLFQALARGVNAPLTTSAGRLFDAVASLAGLRHVSNFEGQAAMELEAAASDGIDGQYPMALLDGAGSRADGGWQSPSIVVDWQPAVDAICRDVAAGVPIGVISAKFHQALASTIAEVARRVGESKVVLTGGCFQNRRLVELAVHALREAGLRPYWHQRVPPNDGGISLGQIVACLREGNG